MRYKFSLNPKVKGYIEWQLEHFREDKQQLESYKRDMIPSPTQSYSLTGGVQSGGPSNPTEQIGIRIATNPYIAATERSVKAIEAVMRRCDSTDLKLVELIYWRQSHTVIGAGESVGLKQNGAYKRINRILCAVALEMGLVNL